jgi:hypothetical protein
VGPVVQGKVDREFPDRSRFALLQGLIFAYYVAQAGVVGIEIPGKKAGIVNKVDSSCVFLFFNC